MIIGARVEQRIVLDEKKTKVAVAGIVVACERSGSPAEYTCLIVRDDGTLTELPAKLLTVVEPALAEIPAFVVSGKRS